MRTVDKLGRDEAQHLKDLFMCMVDHSEDVVDMMLNRNRMYRFLINKAQPGETYFVKNESTVRDRIVYKVTLEKYLKFKIITHEEFKDLILQIADDEAILVVESLIERSLRPKWKRIERKFKKETIEYAKNRNYAERGFNPDNNK